MRVWFVFSPFAGTCSAAELGEPAEFSDGDGSCETDGAIAASPTSGASIETHTSDMCATFVGPASTAPASEKRPDMRDLREANESKRDSSAGVVDNGRGSGASFAATDTLFPSLIDGTSLGRTLALR